MELNVVKTEINIGVKSPVKLLHVTDAHISRAYEDEGEKLTSLAKRHAENIFGGIGVAEGYFDAAIKYAKENDLLPVYTGDMYDFLSRSNFDFLDEKLSETDYIYTAGNHDFCTRPGADVEDETFKAKQMKIVQPHIKNDLVFYSRTVNGLSIVAMDDSYNQFGEKQLTLLKNEIKKGLPTVIFLHNPIYSEKQAEKKLEKEDSAYVVAPPEKILARYTPARAEYQRATDVTLRTVEYIKSEPLIKAIFAGHLHWNFEEPLADCGIMQYTTGALFSGYAREIIIK